MRTLHHWTPTLESKPLSQRVGTRVLLKMECYQPTGSFKIRGVGQLCQYHAQQGTKYFVAFSGGNAGVAVAYAAEKLGAKASVFLPYTSHQRFIDAVQSYGAETIIKKSKFSGVLEAATTFAREQQAAFIPPYDHPMIWNGHATMIEEIYADGYAPDAVILSVGGGGLACGVIEGLRRFEGMDIPVYCVETQGAPGFNQAKKVGKVIDLDDVNTIATSLAAQNVTKQLLEYDKQHPLHTRLVEDHQTIRACHLFLDEHRILVEPSCGAALACLYDGLVDFSQYKNVLVIVCGGIGLSYGMLGDYMREYKITERNR